MLQWLFLLLPAQQRLLLLLQKLALFDAFSDAASTRSLGQRQHAWQPRAIQFNAARHYRLRDVLAVFNAAQHNSKSVIKDPPPPPLPHTQSFAFNPPVTFKIFTVVHSRHCDPLPLGGSSAAPTRDFGLWRERVSMES